MNLFKLLNYTIIIGITIALSMILVPPCVLLSAAQGPVKCVIVYPARDIRPFVMYCVNGKPRSSLLIESTDSMILILQWTYRDSVLSSDARLHVHPIHFLARHAVC